MPSQSLYWGGASAVMQSLGFHLCMWGLVAQEGLMRMGCYMQWGDGVQGVISLPQRGHISLALKKMVYRIVVRGE